MMMMIVVTGTTSYCKPIINADQRLTFPCEGQYRLPTVNPEPRLPRLEYGFLTGDTGEGEDDRLGELEILGILEGLGSEPLSLSKMMALRMESLLEASASSFSTKLLGRSSDNRSVGEEEKEEVVVSVTPCGPV